MIVNLPNFFFIGPKSKLVNKLASALGHNPLVFLPEFTGQHYFSNDEFYRRGIGFYYKKFEQATHEQFKGEYAPDYIHYPEKVVKRLRYLYSRDISELKFVCVLENPFDLLLKSYKENVDAGIESLSLEKALVRELALKSSSSYIQHGYSLGLYQGNSSYASLLAPWIRQFGQERVKVIFDFEVREEREMLKEVEAFIGVPNLGFIPFEKSKSKEKMGAMEKFELLSELPIETVIKIESEIVALEKLLDKDLSNWFLEEKILV